MHHKSRLVSTAFRFLLLATIHCCLQGLIGIWFDPLVAQAHLPQSMGRVTQARFESNRLFLTAAGGRAEITFYEASIIRLRLYQKERVDSLSYAVLRGPDNVKTTFTESDKMLIFESDSLSVHIQKTPFRVSFRDKKGKVINEDDAFGTEWIGSRVTTYKTLQPGERFIGLGEKTGPLDRRGNAYTNWNSDTPGYAPNEDPLYTTFPFYIGIHSTLLYGLFFDNPYRSEFNFGASNHRFASFGAEDGEMNYYFIGGSSIPSILKAYSRLTGTMPLPPLWSLGFQQCRWSYTPDTEVRRVAMTFREKGIPADVMYLDIDYMDQYKVFTWHPNHFKDPKKLLSDLNDLGFKTVVIIDPGIKIETGYKAYEEGLKENAFVTYPDGSHYQGEVWPSWSHFPDFTKPATRQWWGRQFSGLIDYGVKGFWNDMNEPAAWGQRIPYNLIFDFDGQKGTHLRAHNIYGLQMSRSTYEGVTALMPDERPFVLTRAAYSGIQRYSAVWTGDNAANDEHILLGVRLLNSLGLAGVPFVGVDVGGFTGEGSSSALFSRWIGVGAFSPFFRVHAQKNTRSSEPWSYGEETESISRAYIRWRYALLPYYYSLFYEAAHSGLPIQRSLAIRHPFESKTYDWAYMNQFTLGDWIMVAPLKSTEHSVKVFFPGSDWYDAYTDQRIQKGAEMMVEAPLDRLPVFIKAGAIIPEQESGQTTSQIASDTLRIHLYHGSEISEFVYYEDDGVSYAYRDGDFFRQQWKFNPKAKEFKLLPAEGTRLSRFTHIHLIFHGFDDLKSLKEGNVRVTPLPYGVLLPMRSVMHEDKVRPHCVAKGKPLQSVIFKFSKRGTTIGW